MSNCSKRYSKYGETEGNRIKVLTVALSLAEASNRSPMEPKWSQYEVHGRPFPGGHWLLKTYEGSQCLRKHLYVLILRDGAAGMHLAPMSYESAAAERTGVRSSLDSFWRLRAAILANIHVQERIFSRVEV
jgi:hypothetical protein